jgi:hypothetical protein
MRKIPPETDRPVPEPPDPVLGGLSAAGLYDLVDDVSAAAPAERPGEAAELLGALLAVPSERRRALVVAMSKELFDRLKRWRAGRLAKDRAQVPSRTR